VVTSKGKDDGIVVQGSSNAKEKRGQEDPKERNKTGKGQLTNKGFCGLGWPKRTRENSRPSWT
jgi:hypothetical protein